MQAANKFIYRTNSTALEGLEEDGAGELLAGRSDEVRTAVMNLYVPLLPPPPRVVDIIRPTPLLPSSSGAEHWWPSQHIHVAHPAPVESWRVIPSTPSPVSSCDSNHNMWGGVGMNEIQLPSPTPSFSQPYSSAAYSAPQYYTSAPAYHSPAYSSAYSSPPYSAPAVPQLPLPSMMTPQPCSSAVGMGSFGWDRYQEYTMPFAAAM